MLSNISNGILVFLDMMLLYHEQLGTFPLFPLKLHKLDPFGFPRQKYWFHPFRSHPSGAQPAVRQIVVRLALVGRSCTG
jgi:hypothetical protein